MANELDITRFKPLANSEPKTLFDYAKRHGAPMLLDNIFVTTGKSCYQQAKHINPSSRQLMVMAQQWASEAALHWKNNNGLEAWYHALVIMYCAETSRAMKEKRTVGIERADFIRYQLTQQLERHIMQAVAVHSTYKHYQRSVVARNDSA